MQITAEKAAGFDFIKAINGSLEKVGSCFRTEDGTDLTMYVGKSGEELTFLVKRFNSPEEAYEFVKKAEIKHSAKKGECI
jgi:hypothetical protein